MRRSWAGAAGTRYYGRRQEIAATGLASSIHDDPSVRTPPRAIALLALGTNWPLFKVALDESSVWSFRTLARGHRLGSAVRCREAARRPSWRAAAAVVAPAVRLDGQHHDRARRHGAGRDLPCRRARASILAYTMPLWLAPLAAMFLGQRFTVRTLLPIALGVPGGNLADGAQFRRLR